MCLYPKIIRNRKYTSNKKNGGDIPPLSDERIGLVPVGCQNCMECRKKKAREWHVRLLEDVRENTNGKFITLTFSDKQIKYIVEGKDTEGKIIAKPLTSTGYTLDNEIATIAVRRWLERWRKKYKKSLRHWMITELGHKGTENIHLHGIIWTDEPLEEVEKSWAYGYMWKGKKEKGKIVNYVNGKTASYITKYVMKIDEKHPRYKSIVLTSPGIGAAYLKRADWKKNQFNGENTREFYRTSTGHKMAMPIYWRNKIYKEEEREQLWLQKLDQEIRYVNGCKIDVSKSLNEYMNAVKYAREENRELGYGNDEKDYEQEEYERQQRTIKQLTRIKKGANQRNGEVSKQTPPKKISTEKKLDILLKELGIDRKDIEII